MDYVTSLPLSADWKGNSNNSILVIVNRLTKMVHYEPVKVIIDAPRLAKVIIDVVVRHHGLPDSIISDRGAILRLSFGPCSVTSSVSNGGSQPRSTLRQTVKTRGRSAPWKPTFEPSSISNKMTG